MKLLKVMNVLRIVTFLATLLTTIPLFINYLKGVEPPYPLVTHLHVWFGLAFFIFAIISMILNKKLESKG